MADLFGLPARKLDDFDWEEIERDAGVRLPADYKALCEYLPHGWFRRFVRLSKPVRLPGGEQRFLSDFQADQMETLWEWRADDDQDQFPYPLFPEPGGLLMWGSLRGGGHAFWLTGQGAPDSWPVVLASAQCDHWEQFDGTVSDFLAQVMAARYDATGFLEGPFKVVVYDSGVTDRTGQPVVLADRPVFEPDTVPAHPRAPVVPPSDFWPERVRQLGSHRPFRNEMPVLRELLGEPTWRVPAVDWEGVRARLGFQLPADYREFVDTYGPGMFLDIRIAGPGAPGDMDLFALLDRKYDEVTRVARSLTPPFYPEPGGTVCWGETVDGWSCAWAPATADPDEWTVTVITPGTSMRGISLRSAVSFSTMLRLHAQPDGRTYEFVPPHNLPGPVSFTPCEWPNPISP
jgi:hypothetical protein